MTHQHFQKKSQTWNWGLISQYTLMSKWLLLYFSPLLATIQFPDLTDANMVWPKGQRISRCDVARFTTDHELQTTAITANALWYWHWRHRAMANLRVIGGSDGLWNIYFIVLGGLFFNQRKLRHRKRTCSKQRNAKPAAPFMSIQLLGRTPCFGSKGCRVGWYSISKARLWNPIQLAILDVRAFPEKNSTNSRSWGFFQPGTSRKATSSTSFTKALNERGWVTECKGCNIRCINVSRVLSKQIFLLIWFQLPGLHLRMFSSCKVPLGL